MTTKVRTLYIGLENTWPADEDVGKLTSGLDYTRVGLTIFVHKHLKPGLYETGKPYMLRLITHHRIPSHLSLTTIMREYPSIIEWSGGVPSVPCVGGFIQGRAPAWPCPVGRYIVDEHNIVDVVFSKHPDGDSALLPMRECIVSPTWTPKQKNEWLSGSYGYWTGWTYDLKTAVLASLSMDIIQELPPEQRTPQKIVRHIVSMASEANSPKGLLHGMWDSKRFCEGHEPSVWKSTYQILSNRVRTGSPVKFAQCWIFSEVLVSVFRYLGIPSRTVFVENARIDRGNDGGVDIGVAVSKGADGIIEAKEDKDIDILAALTAAKEVIGHFSNDVTCKCDEVIPLPEINFDESEVVFKGEGCPEIDLRTYITSDDSIWNFHVFPEVWLPLAGRTGTYDWHCVDGCPVAQTDSKDEYNGKKVLGPCPVKAIKAGVETEHDFKYFNSTVNAIYRYWRTQRITLLDGQELDVVYPHNVVYGCLTGSAIDKRQVRMFIRNPETSSGPFHIVKQSVLDSYKPDPKVAFDVHHRYHPVLFKWSSEPPNGSLNMNIQHDISSQHFVQICYLSDFGSIISCDRQLVDSWDAYVPPPTPIEATKISIVVADFAAKRWWIQVA